MSQSSPTLVRTPQEMGLPPLLLIRASGLHLSLVSPDQITEAKEILRGVLPDLHRIETHLRAYASDDDFDQPNFATHVKAQVALALAALAGGGA